jgi:hypothetical protein
MDAFAHWPKARIALQENRLMPHRTALSVARTLSFLALVSGCAKVRAFLLGDPEAIPTVQLPPLPPPPPTVLVAPERPKPRAPVKLEDGSLASTEYLDARDYKASGQIWKARLTLEPRALAVTGTPNEIKLLHDICTVQNDQDCIEACTTRLSGKGVESVFERAKKLGLKDPRGAKALLIKKFDGGGLDDAEFEYLRNLCTRTKDAACLKEITPPPAPSVSSTANVKDDSDRARALSMKDPKAAKALLEPKAKAKTATPKELAILCALCSLTSDTACTTAYCP